MTAPRLALPADFYNRPPKELAGYSSVSVTNGGQVPGPGVPGVADEAIPFWDGSILRVLVNQPAASTYYAHHGRIWYDARTYTHARLVIDVAVAGASGAQLRLEYHTNPNADPYDNTGWLTAGLAGDIAVAINAVGAAKGGWLPLDDAARVDVVWRVMALGGDGATTPVLGYGAIEFRQAPIVPPERFYWRDLTPGNAPTEDNLSVAYFDFNGLGQQQLEATWVTPTPATVTANPRVFYPARSTTAETTFQGTSIDEHKDYSGILGRLVGPPLKAQTLPAWAYRSGYKAVYGSGGGAGYLQLQLHVWRPGSGIVQTWVQSSAQTTAAWFRFVAKQRIALLTVPFDFTLQDNDRLVMDLIGNADTFNGALNTTNGLSPWIYYDGTQEGFTDGADAGVMNAASWTDFPPLQYVTRDPTVTIP